MATKMPRSISFFITSAALTSSFSESSLTVMPSEIVISRLIGGGPGIHVPALRPQHLLFFHALARLRPRTGRCRRDVRAALPPEAARVRAPCAPREVGCCGRGPPGRRARGAPGRTPGLVTSGWPGRIGSAINRLAGHRRRRRLGNSGTRRTAARPAWPDAARSAWRPDRDAAEPPVARPAGRRAAALLRLLWPRGPRLLRQLRALAAVVCRALRQRRTRRRRSRVPGAGRAPSDGRGKRLARTGKNLAGPRRRAGRAGIGLAAGAAGRPGAITAAGGVCDGVRWRRLRARPAEAAGAARSGSRGRRRAGARTFRARHVPPIGG